VGWTHEVNDGISGVDIDLWQSCSPPILGFDGVDEDDAIGEFDVSSIVPIQYHEGPHRRQQSMTFGKVNKHHQTYVLGFV
jgi:hypothetical protein